MNKTPFVGFFALNRPNKSSFKTPFLGFFALFLKEFGYKEGKISGWESFR